MEKNIGNIDSLIRILIGFAALYLAFLQSVYWLILALIALGTGITRKCPLYSLIGISTIKNKSVNASVKKKR
jgi:hypothetical protein